MNWKKFSIAFISAAIALFATHQIILACFDFNYYDTHPQFLSNTATNKPVYSPFNFIIGQALYEDESYDIDEQNKKLLLEEWKNYIGQSVKEKDIKNLLYQSDLNTITEISKGKNTLSGNTFANYLVKKENKKILDYIIYAKKCESNALKNQESWESEKPKAIDIHPESLKQEGIKNFKREKDKFLKMKYAFQVLRIAFYEEQYDEVLKLFESLLGNQKDNSIAYTRSIGFKAGAYYRKEDYSKAAYYYSRMFDHHDAYKVDALISFKWSYESTNLNAIYQHCKNNQEKAVVLGMKTLRNTDISVKDLEQIYSFDPTLNFMDVLFNREINKMELNYFSFLIYRENKAPYPYYYYEYSLLGEQIPQRKSDSLKSIYNPQIERLNQLANKIIKDNKNNSTAYWHLTKAYLALMQKQNATALKELSAAKENGMNPKEQTLYQTLDLLYTIAKNKTITPQIEAEMLPKLKDLDELSSKNSIASSQFRDIMQNLIAGKYFAQKDTIKGIYAMARPSKGHLKYSTPENYVEWDFEDRPGDILNLMNEQSLKKAINFRENNTKNAFEQWLINNTYYTSAVLNELLGTVYIRQRKWEDAARIFSQKGISTKKFPSPFMPQINDYLEITKKDTLNTYTRLRFVQRMAELKTAIEKNPKDAGALYGYALAFYNISHYGKAGNITNFSRHSVDDYAYYQKLNDKKLPHFLTEYYRVYEAEQYFNKAAAASDDPEMKAKALWGAAKCWTKRCTYNEETIYNYNSGQPDDYYINALKSPYFNRLSKDFAHTKFMKEVRGTCEYYSDYVKTR